MQAYTIVLFGHGNDSKITINLDPKPLEGPPFSNTNLMWISGIRHKGQNKMLIKFVYIPHAHTSDFLKGEQGDLENLGTYIRIWHHKKRSRFQLSRTTSITHGKCPIARVFFPH